MLVVQWVAIDGDVIKSITKFRQRLYNFNLLTYVAIRAGKGNREVKQWPLTFKAASDVV